MRIESQLITANTNYKDKMLFYLYSEIEHLKNTISDLESIKVDINNMDNNMFLFSEEECVKINKDILIEEEKYCSNLLFLHKQLINNTDIQVRLTYDRCPYYSKELQLN